MKVTKADPVKKVMRKVVMGSLATVEKAMGATGIGDSIRDILDNTGDPATAVLRDILDDVVDLTERRWQRRTARTFGEFALWLMHEDTAYRDQMLYVVARVLEAAPALLPVLDEERVWEKVGVKPGYLDEATEAYWYANLHERVQNQMEEDIANGTIEARLGPFERPFDEDMRKRMEAAAKEREDS